MQGRPTGVVAACKDINLGREIQELFASPNMRVNTTTDVTGGDVCGFWGGGGLLLVVWACVLGCSGDAMRVNTTDVTGPRITPVGGFCAGVAEFELSGVCD
jgi:hypothetical protein